MTSRLKTVLLVLLTWRFGIIVENYVFITLSQKDENFSVTFSDLGIETMMSFTTYMATIELQFQKRCTPLRFVWIAFCEYITY